MTDFDPADAGLSLLSLFAGWGLADDLQRRLVADGFDDSRFADGVVFQHLIERPLAIGVLAERLGVTQQGASKSVADLERRGYLVRRADPADARARLVDLTERGRGVITAARRHRAAIEGEVITALGAERVDAARLLLADVLTHLGADAPLRMRRAKPPR